MPETLEVYDRALHEAPAPAVQMAQRLLTFVKSEIASGTSTRKEVHARLEELHEYYAERGCVEEREAVADVLDVFEGWAPMRATV